MEVIEKTPDDEYDSICKAGVELVSELTRVLKKHGLERHQAFNVLVVAAAGVAAASELSSGDLAAGVDSCIHMWRVHDDGNDRIATFDPAYLRPGYVAPEQDLLASN